MAANFADRVKETTTTTGTGSLTLAGAVTGYQTFNAAFSVGATSAFIFWYVIEAINSSGVPTGDWETGIGYLSASTTLVRSSVLKSSNSNNAVSFSAGTKNVFCAPSSAFLNAIRPEFNPPTTTLFSYSDNAASTTQTVTYDAKRGYSMQRTDAGSANERIAFRGKAVPASTPWTATAKILFHNVQTTGNFTRGIGITNSSSKKTIIMGPQSLGGTLKLCVTYWTNLTTFSSDLVALTRNAEPMPTWFRIGFDGTTYTFYASYDDGITWTTITTGLAASFMTADNVGIGMVTSAAFTSPYFMTVKHYDDADYVG